jgi:phosphatidylglycerophosphatase A
MMKLNFIEKLLGSGFYTGYIPVASGTFGSLAALLIYLIPGFENIYVIIPSIIIVIIIGIPLGTKFEQVYKMEDPPYCTIDEVAGMWISLILIPKEIIPVLAAFFLWRLMDIIKPYPARKFESLPGGLGVMMDDIAAGIYSLVLVHIFLLFFM